MAPKIETPRGVIVINVQGKAELKFNPNFTPKWTRHYSQAQKFVDSEVLRLCEPFIPLLTGTLIRSGILGTDVGSGSVYWIAPYARYQYYGKVMIGRRPKKVTNRNLTYHGGGKRGAFWFERMKEISGKAIIEGAKRLVGQG